MPARILSLTALTAVAVVAMAIVWSALGGQIPGSGGSAKADPADVSLEPPPQSAGTAPAAEPPGRPIPVLMYHATEAPPAGTAYPDLWVPARRFAAQMQMLRREGYNAVTMRQAAAYWAGRATVPRKPVVLTFDDGFASNARVALPVLRRMGWRGVLYLELGALHTRPPEGISESDVHRLLDAGWELGSHSMEHPDLAGLPADRLRYEVARSRTELTRRFGVTVDSFCYPDGSYDRAAVAEVRRAGYATATTTAAGLAAPPHPLELRRIRVEGGDSPAALSARIRAAGQ
ncbi:MAG TPA: polysaccharide deacetylase family protein [Thermoleophilaceae bacterium]|nr:polysaccharide deacetylase family protein [Thermoleophilaceae bacterium]